MSIRWISHVWERSPYRGERLLIHLALADFANDEGYCFPSQKTLAKKARCTDTYVRLVIKELVKSGLLEVVERGNGRGHRSEYVLKGVTTKEALENRVSEKGVTTERERRNSDENDSYIKNRQEPSILTTNFETFWKSYPRRVGRAAAFKAFKRIFEKDDAPTIEELVEAVERYKQATSDAKYFCHPATWLNQARYLDEYDAKDLKPLVNPLYAKYDATLSTVAALFLTGKKEEDVVALFGHRPNEELETALRYFRERVANSKRG